MVKEGIVTTKSLREDVVVMEGTVVIMEGVVVNGREL